MERLDREFPEIIAKMIENSPARDTVITEDNVYQEGDPTNKPLMELIVNTTILPGSRILGFENLVDLHRRAKAGDDCLILMEHYSNLDLPCFYELLEREDEVGKEITDSIVSMAGFKLNEESDLVRSFTEIFTRVVIYPSRGLEQIADPEKRKAALEKKERINRAAFKELYRLKKSGRIVNVYPTGTRYRPWDPSTGRGMRDADSYVRYFKWMTLVAVNGNGLVINPESDMSGDIPTRDIIIYTASSVFSCKEYRERALRSLESEADPKQHVVDTVMNDLKRIHAETEKKRALLIASAGR